MASMTLHKFWIPFRLNTQKGEVSPVCRPHPEARTECVVAQSIVDARPGSAAPRLAVLHVRHRDGCTCLYLFRATLYFGEHSTLFVPRWAGECST